MINNNKIKIIIIDITNIEEQEAAIEDHVVDNDEINDIFSIIKKLILYKKIIYY